MGYLMLLLVSLLPPGLSQDQDNSEVLMGKDREFQRASSERGLEGWLSYFAEDATIFPAGFFLLEEK